ncbi:hypothetical protein O1611_g3223 [Lasiodiplodia mahajangana]|uniref:Uncharacterized protein n=1 Tax=Lasiodiplodia mahajangana TaxID=1108764 RepID=A0ACC2JSJ3_9PEZI|nr:hypothetical protein O1611_g3223 [Lasiodiplodia mahajangana]
MDSLIPYYLATELPYSYCLWASGSHGRTVKTLDLKSPRSASPLGSLDRFPPEIIYMVLDRLDAGTVARFSRVSIGGYTIVQDHLPYTSLVRYALLALAVLKEVQLIGLHSITELYAALQSKQCTFCNDFGPYLFLPTCERCCYNCHAGNPRLRMIEFEQAEAYFALTEESIQQLPIVCVPLRVFNLRDHNPRWDCIHPLVSFEAAKNLAITIHQSTENMVSKIEEMHDAHRSEWNRNESWELREHFSLKDRWFRNATYLHEHGIIPEEDKDDFLGAAFTLFPSVPKPGTVENGLWCTGCELSLRRFNQGSFKTELPRETFASARLRAYSVESFRSHISLCDGALRFRRAREDERNNGLSDDEVMLRAMLD